MKNKMILYGIIALVLFFLSSCNSKIEPLPESVYGTYKPDLSKPWNSENNDHINYFTINKDSTFVIDFHTGYYCDYKMTGTFKVTKEYDGEYYSNKDLSFKDGGDKHWLHSTYTPKGEILSRHFITLNYKDKDESGWWNVECVDQSIIHDTHPYALYPEAVIVLSNEDGGKAFVGIVDRKAGYIVAEMPIKIK